MWRTPSTSIPYWSTLRQFMSVWTTTFATLRWTNTSPGCRPMMRSGGRRLSEQPIHRICGDCWWRSRSKNSGSAARMRAAHSRLAARQSSSSRIRILLSPGERPSPRQVAGGPVCHGHSMFCMLQPRGAQPAVRRKPTNLTPGSGRASGLRSCVLEQLQRAFVAHAFEETIEQAFEHRTLGRHGGEQGGARAELQVVRRAEDLARGTSLDPEEALRALDQPGPEHGVAQVGLGLVAAPDRVAHGRRAEADPANWGKTYHIQCDRLRPLRISPSAASYTRSCACTKRSRSCGSAFGTPFLRSSPSPAARPGATGRAA